MNNNRRPCYVILLRTLLRRRMFFSLVLCFIILECFLHTHIYSIRLPHPQSVNQESQRYGSLLNTLIFKNNTFLKTNTNNNSNIIINNNAIPTNLSSESAIDLTLIRHTDKENLDYSGNNVNGLFDLSTIVTKSDNYTGAVLSSTEVPLCLDISQTLSGRIPVEKYTVPTTYELERKFSSWLKPGGHWSPENCRVEKKMALVVPFMGRGKHLPLFLQHMHPFLRTQQLDYTIFIVEQHRDTIFNKAMIMNVGYVEALKLRDFDCFIFHDVDLLPEDNRNLYTCPEQTRHMSITIDVLDYRLPYPSLFGGVTAIRRDHFQLLNGYSNSFWGWGGEDDDMFLRIRHHNLYISRYPPNIARYTMLAHVDAEPNTNRYKILQQSDKRFDKDGLNSLKYELLQVKRNLLYTWILVKLEKPK